MKSFLTLTAFVFVAIGIDLTLSLLGVPITVMDILLTPLSIAIVLYSFSPSFLANRLVKIDAAPTPLYHSLGMSAVFALIITMAIYLLVLGATDPLLLFTSVKGAAHGYTLASLSIAILSISGSVLYIHIFRKLNA